MERRTFLKTAAAGAVVVAAAGEAFGAERYFPTKADQTLFENINRVKDPANKTPLEKTHGPKITAPDKAQAGQPFAVEVSVGEALHGMSPAHWIEYIELSVGNEPAGRIDFQSKGYLSPKASFTVVIPKEAAPTGKITLIARQRCNLHGYWESSMDIAVA